MGNVIFVPGNGEPNKANIVSSLTANNTTASNVLFAFTGVIECRIWGVVTTVLSSNITAAHWRQNDQTNTPAITVAAGTTLSSAAVGTIIQKNGLAAAALISSTSAQTRVIEHATSGLKPDTWWTAVALPGVANTIDFRYSTTNTPATGAIQFFLEWYPRSANATVS